MGTTVRAVHGWCVTRGNHPAEHPYYCPLNHFRHSAAVAEYHQLLQPVPDNANDLRICQADMAVVIPQEDARFWYHLTAAATTPWQTVDPTTDLQALRAQAAQALARAATGAAPQVIGDHPATGPAVSLDTTSASIKDLWLVTHADDNANDPGTWARDIPGADINSYDKARRLYLTTAQQVNDVKGLPGPPEPTEHITFWHCLQSSAQTPWLTEDTHADPTALTAILAAAAQTPGTRREQAR